MTLAELTAKLRDVLDRRSDIKFALLFGSSANRGVDRARDVDLAIATTSKLPLFELGALADALERAVGKPVDLVEIEDASTLLRWEVVRTGQVVTAPHGDALHELRARVPLEYADLQPYLEREAAGLARALGVR